MKQQTNLAKFGNRNHRYTNKFFHIKHVTMKTLEDFKTAFQQAKDYQDCINIIQLAHATLSKEELHSFMYWIA